MKTREVDELRISKRTTIRKGDVVKLRKGPFYRTTSGDEVLLSLRGSFVVVGVLQSFRGASHFLEVVGLDDRAGTFTVLVSGKTSKREGVVWRPFKVRKVRGLFNVKK